MRIQDALANPFSEESPRILRTVRSTSLHPDELYFTPAPRSCLGGGRPAEGRASGRGSGCYMLMLMSRPRVGVRARQRHLVIRLVVNLFHEF